MKKILFSLIALVCSMSMNAQVMKVMKNGEEVAKYNGADYTVVFEEAPATNPHLLPGVFSVSATKTVKFTKSNLYWSSTDSKFHFETQPTDYPTTRTTTHVGHFFWTKTAAASYAATYGDGTNEASDKFFADGSDAAHTLTVDGISDLYVLSAEEWTYLLQTRTNASSLFKYGVTVNGKANCLVIAPDGFTGTIESSYTLEALETAGLVCLPAAGGMFNGSSVTTNDGNYGYYWSSTPNGNNNAKCPYFGSSNANVSWGSRGNGYSVRAVLAEN